MADPTPSINLPTAEWVELKNTSPLSINLLNWRIGDTNGISGPMPSCILPPDSMVIICSGNSLAGLSAWGRAIAVQNFPSLDNDGELLYLRSWNGWTIHAVNYSSTWYQNEVKKEGGWSLEIIDPQMPCAGKENWLASTNHSGGTPGKVNSVDGIRSSQKLPDIINAFTTDSVTMILEFEEPIDSISGSTALNFQVTGGLNVSEAETLRPLFSEVRLETVQPMNGGQVYTITANNIKPCKSNHHQAIIVKTGIPGDPNPGELIINEILFNPRSTGDDYVELYNNSQQIIDVSRVFIGNRNSNNVISNIRPLSTRPRYIFPGDHPVITGNAYSINLHYHVRHPQLVETISSLPSFPDDRGTVVLQNFQGTIIDELAYSDKWHFPLIDDPEGVSLERIDPFSPTQDPSNWHSAASTAGYGTPTYRNSQSGPARESHAFISISPTIFSPDNDGRDDFLVIQYALESAGYMANIVVFDASGRVVRRLVRNQLLGIKGTWTWDGLDDRSLRIPIGPYIVFTELFTLEGKKRIFKNTVILARPLK